MNTDSYTTAFTVDQSPAEVFAAICDVRSWWTGDIDGTSDELGDAFTYRYEAMHRSRQQIVERVPNERIVWRVIDAELNFVRDKTEWIGTEIVFEIGRRDGKTELRFTHRGLVPAVECFDDCSNAWGYYINGSLRQRIAGMERRSA